MMNIQKVGFLHPGEMGISVAVSAKNSAHQVYWVSEGRSGQTRARAEKFELIDTGTLEELCETCSVIISVCPPHAAEETARHVLGYKFDGLYVDVNAISPQRAIRIGESMGEAGAAFVDGCIIGGPAWEPGRTWLYLCGEGAQLAADCFSGGPLETCIIDGPVGKASALKMCYAGYSKGSTALICAILATAEQLGVRGELEEQWSKNGSDFSQQAERRARRVTKKAWRFHGEMDEISATFSEAGMPGEFHAAAAEVYRRLARFKDAAPTPGLEEVLEALLREPEPG